MRANRVSHNPALIGLGDVLQIIGICLGDAFTKTGLESPTEHMQTRDVEQITGLVIGFGGIENQFPAVAPRLNDFTE